MEQNLAVAILVAAEQVGSIRMLDTGYWIENFYFV